MSDPTDTQPADTDTPATERTVEVLEDQLCRRVWAAAGRHLAGRIDMEMGQSPGYEITTVVAEWSDRIESGVLTPWADQPEPPAAPDPTHGRIDRDIQATDDWGPTSLGQRVAIENTLQEQRDAGREPLTPPAAPAEPSATPPAATGPHEAEMDAAVGEFAALPDCQHCDGTGKQVPNGWYERRRDAERRAAEVIQPAVDALTPEQIDTLVAISRPEPAPEPDSGTGWDPTGALAAADIVAAKLGEEDAQAVRRVIRHTRALARRCAIRFEEMQAARAELAQMTADRDSWEQAAGDMEARERHAAAAALGAGAEFIRDAWDGADAGPEVCARSLHAMAADIRERRRPVPGSPQPAGGGDDG